MNAAWNAYRGIARLLGGVAPWARALAPVRERGLWSERMGRVSLPDGCHAWVHAASLGEAVAVSPFVAELRSLQPDARLCLTATTRTGRARLAATGCPVSLAPIDSPQAVGEFFRGVRPARLFLIETELWPHWLLRARDERIPVAVVSARLSEGSARGYRRLGAPLRDLVEGLAAVLCQTPEDEARWQALGARPGRTRVAGNLKHDALPATPPDHAAARAAAGLDPARPLLVLGSVRPGEARLIAGAWMTLPAALRGAWQVVAVPRHARTTRDLIAETAGAGITAALERAPAGEGWRWDDRPGVLMEYYSAADVAVVCGSLRPYGGHNPMEAAACGAAVIVGAHHASQSGAVRTLERHGGVVVAADGAALARALDTLLSDEGARAARARAALAAVRSERGAARRAVAHLAEWGIWPVS
jgi:3-deoxy-D-manno-octulosonic-acid transferase